jgi:SAM-dependent methyltransferase
MSEGSIERAITEHYGTGALLSAIDAELQRRGLNPQQIGPADLEAIDHFHTAGAQSTIGLAGLAGLRPGMKAIDIGGGTGGPARLLASRYACEVTVLDLTPEFCTTGAVLAARVGLGERVRFCQGSALSIPLASARFGLAWTMQSSMNIADKQALYGEIARVLARQGRLAIQEYMAGPAGPAVYPTPFARDASMAFLLPPNEQRGLIQAAGFRELFWRDVTDALNQLPAGHRMVSLVHGAEEQEMQHNMRRNREEHRLVVVQAVFEKS